MIHSVEFNVYKAGTNNCSGYQLNEIAMVNLMDYGCVKPQWSTLLDYSRRKPQSFILLEATMFHSSGLQVVQAAMIHQLEKTAAEPILPNCAMPAGENNRTIQVPGGTQTSVAYKTQFLWRDWMLKWTRQWKPLFHSKKKTMQGYHFRTQHYQPKTRTLFG